MKILQLGKAYPPANLGGVEVVIQLLTEGLNDKGISCDALGVNDVPKYVVEKYQTGKIYRARLLTKKFSTLFSFQLIGLLRKIWRNYDVITIHSPDPMSCFALWIVRPHCKIITYYHSDILRQKLLLKFYSPFLNWLLKRSDLILTSSPNYILGSEVLQKYKDKCDVLPIGVDVAHTELLRKNRFSRYLDKKIVFSLGRLAYYKGYEYLVLAALDLPEDVLIIIAGEGEEQEKLKQVITQNNLDEKVILAGRIDENEKFFLFKNAKIFALSSIYKTEAYAIVQVEALSNGLPIVSTRIAGSGVDWVNQDKITGMTVPVNDAKAIAIAINTILKDNNLYLQYSRNALSRYTELFTREKMINKAVKFYEKVLS